MVSLHIGVYWPAHSQDSLESCASKMREYYSELSKLSRNLQIWYKKGGSRSGSRDIVDFDDLEFIRMWLMRGVSRTDIGSQLMPDLGFRVGAWNGGAGGWDASISVACGINSNATGVPNSAYLRILCDKATSPALKDCIDFFKVSSNNWGAHSGKVWQEVFVREDKDGRIISRDEVYSAIGKCDSLKNSQKGQFERFGQNCIWTSSLNDWN